MSFVDRASRRDILAICLFAIFSLTCLQAQEHPADIREAIVQKALSFQGVRYVYGAQTPEGFDCSGFVRYIYNETLGLPLPRSAEAIWETGEKVSIENAKRGDIVVFDTVGGRASHVGILLDSETFIHAASQGPKTGVIISRFDEVYYAARFMGARTWLPPEQAPQEEPSALETVASAIEGAMETVADHLHPEPALSQLGLTITNTLSEQRDSIPAARGSAIQFVITNATDRSGTFQILIQKLDGNPPKPLRKERVTIAAGGRIDLDSFTFTEIGQYQLILSASNGEKRVERFWKVVDLD